MIELILSTLLFLSQETTVEADAQAEGWRVSGQIFLDESFSGSETTKRVAATCENCRWLVTNYCKRESPYQKVESCDLPVLGCETELGSGVRMRVWRQVSPNEDWMDVGIVCITPKGPVTPQVVTEIIQEEAVIYLPPLKPTSKPNAEALVKLPIHFSANQPTKFGPALVEVAGLEVLLTAYPTWVWNFQNRMVTTSKNEISHTWNKSGRYQVLVNARWRAEWQIAGSSIRSAPNLEQRSSFYLQIRPAWAQLTR